jgi:pyruvate kinase
MKNTKIVATIGPASEKIMKDLINAGVDVFRFNMKHGEISHHSFLINEAQKEADKLKKHISIIADLQGQEIRIKIEKDIVLERGERVVIGKDIIIDNDLVQKEMAIGDTIIIDDGFVELKVVERDGNYVIAEAVEKALIKNRKTMNLPGKKITLSSLIEEDLKRLDGLARNKVDYVALSFVQNKKDIETLEEELRKRKIDAKVMAKIENSEALENIDEIIESSDAIMIARGDLGIEVPIEELAYWQKIIIEKCRLSFKPVIVATQMLHSMINNPRPTRAEATDIANAVFDGTDAVMLSEETAMGNYPIRAVEAMKRILSFNEQNSKPKRLEMELSSSTDLVIAAVNSILEKIEQVVVFTESGYTARVLSAFRPNHRIIAVTDNQKTADLLTLSYGVSVLIASPIINNKLKKKLIDNNWIETNKRLLVVQGKHKKTPEIAKVISLINL